MYQFVDTTPGTNVINRPAEAVSINGVYLEDIISGYQTLSVSGRESLEGAVESLENTASSGAFFLSKRYPSRTITVRYRIAAQNSQAFREAYNKFNEVLSQEEATFIFDDEPDKYFIGTKTGGEEPEEGRNCVTGTYQIFCSDPFKYSVSEKAVPLQYSDAIKGWIFSLKGATANRGSIAIPARYDIRTTQENGFLALEGPSQSEVLNFGSWQECDTERQTSIVRLLDFDDIESAPADSSSAHPFTTVTTAQRSGAPVRRWIALNPNYSTCASGSGWCLSQKTIALPSFQTADGTRSSARDFYCKSYHWFETGANGQTGEQILQFLDAWDKEICAFGITKSDQDGNTARAYFRCNGKIHWMSDRGFAANSSNPYGSSAQREGHNAIAKEGSRFMYFWMGSSFWIQEPELENAEVHKVRLIMQHLRPLQTGRYVTRNYLGDDFRFEAKNVPLNVNIPNTFHAGAQLSADGMRGVFEVDGCPRPDLEILGSRYFKIPPGESIVRVILSSWITDPSAVQGTMYFREAWI